MKESFNSLLKRPYRRVLRFMEFIEDRITDKKQDECGYSPLFIIGLPRSGTTVFYQLMAYCFNVCYINNLMRRYRFPCLLSYLVSFFKGCEPSEKLDFKSWYGQTSGWRNPEQGWLFWECFFKTDQQIYLDEKGLSEGSAVKMRNAVLFIQDIFKKPFLNKSQRIALRILPINKSLPEALFIRIKRDHLDVAQSILRGRKVYFNDVNHWFSAKPSRYSELKDKDYIQQICGQICYLEEDMDRDIKKIGEHRCLTINYKDLCNDPEKICEEIEAFYNKNTVKGKIYRRHKAPGSFKFSTGKKCSDSEYESLKEGLHSYFECSEQNY
jgi:hypothetical protein